MTPRRAIPRDLAHELRTPLAAVITTLDLIASGELQLDPSEVTEIVQAAKADAEHLLTIIDETRSATGAGQAESVAVAEVARRVLDRFPTVKSRTHVQIDRSVTADADIGAIDQILTNLFQNIARYAPGGGVEVSVSRLGAEAVVEVSDDGPGISDPETVFQEGAGSQQGMHVGLSISRRLARDYGGDLAVTEPRRGGATFRLTLPAGDFAAADPSPVAIAPRARVLIELADALAQRSLERVEAGISRIAHDLLGTSGVALLVQRGDWFVRVNGSATTRRIPAAEPVLAAAVVSELPVWVEDEVGEWWTMLTGAERGVAVGLDSNGGTEAVLLLGMPGDSRIDPADEVLHAVATVGALAVGRTTLGQDLAVERGLRSSVMEALPIAISIFAGDPPRVVDMNAAERRMLGLEEGETRPEDLELSQKHFDVRFADGTPLTVESAPVTQAIRAGERQGPFHLRVRRADGSEFVSRTYCAPFFDGDGRVAGAVVASEEIDPADI